MTQARGHARCLIAVYHPRAENLVVNYCGRRNLPSTTILMKEPHATARPTARYSNGIKSRRRAVQLSIQETSIGSELCGKSAALVPRAVAVVNK